MDARMIPELTRATEQVFETMVFTELKSGSPIEGDALRPRSNVVAQIAFAGSASGIVAFYSTMNGARDIAARMLMMEPAEVNGELPDAIGEITNMIAGSFRTAMSSEGDAWAISPPTVTVGSDFYTTHVGNVRRVLCPFRMGDEEIFVELVLRVR